MAGTAFLVELAEARTTNVALGKSINFKVDHFMNARGCECTKCVRWKRIFGHVTRCKRRIGDCHVCRCMQGVDQLHQHRGCIQSRCKCAGKLKLLRARS